jgi:Fe-S-cluster containining protein
MGKKLKIGRNAPCPCGSGKKYKSCCGEALPTSIQSNKTADPFRLNMDIAYKGRLGRQREEFGIQYTKTKQETLKKIEQKQTAWAQARGETITCHKGCAFCCTQHIPASLHECEAIVYYLYQNEKVLRFFLLAYARWANRIENINDLLARMERLFNEMVSFRFSEDSKQAFLAEADKYAAQNIPCPFLRDNACLIHPVRPWTCASLFATSPAEWCHPLNPNKAKTYTDTFGLTVKLPFYYKPFKDQVYSFLPVMVYEILEGGFFYLAWVTGSKSLLAEATNDPEIRIIVDSYAAK